MIVIVMFFKVDIWYGVFFFYLVIWNLNLVKVFRLMVDKILKGQYLLKNGFNYIIKVLVMDWMEVVDIIDDFWCIIVDFYVVRQLLEFLRLRILYVWIIFLYKSILFVFIYCRFWDDFIVVIMFQIIIEGNRFVWGDMGMIIDQGLQ